MEVTTPFLPRLASVGTLLLAACSAGEGSPSSIVAPPAPAPERVSWKPSAPVNVVLIVIDTLRADAVFDPGGRYDTPNIDRLAHEGIAFPHTFSAAPMTLPSHMSLFSSRSPFETKVLNNGQDVPQELPLLAEWLAAQGYDTRAVISLGTLNASEPDPNKGPRRGFASYEHDPWFMSSAERTEKILSTSLAERDATKPLFLFAHFADPHEPYDAHGTEQVKVNVTVDGTPVGEVVASETGLWNATVELPPGHSQFQLAFPEGLKRKFRVRSFDCQENSAPLELHWEQGAIMERLNKALIAVDRGERPSATCNLFVWVNDVPASNDSLRTRYALEVAYVDRYIGELLAELERLGLYQDSLIVFTSDHGEALGEHKLFGHVERLSDEMIHVPLIVKLPKGDPRGPELVRAAEGTFTHLDLVPTLLEIVGQPPLPGQRGHSVFDPHAVVHVSQTTRPEAKKTQIALRDARFDMVFFPDENRFELYDLAQDPGEMKDVFAERAKERPDWAERLRWIHAETLGEFGAAPDNEDEAAREAMLKALGYGGEEE